MFKASHLGGCETLMTWCDVACFTSEAQVIWEILVDVLWPWTDKNSGQVVRHAVFHILFQSVFMGRAFCCLIRSNVSSDCDGFVSCLCDSLYCILLYANYCTPGEKPLSIKKCLRAKQNASSNNDYNVISYLLYTLSCFTSTHFFPDLCKCF